MKENSPQLFRVTICFCVFASLFFFQSCEKENAEYNDLAIPTVNEEASTRTDLYSENVTAIKFREMILSHFKNDGGRDPLYYFPTKIREEFFTEYEEQEIELKALGRTAYLEARRIDGTISPYFANSIVALDPILVEINSGRYEKTIDYLITQRPSAEIPSDEAIGIISLYDVIIAHIENAINNEDQATLREPCSLSELIDDVIDGATIGAAVGGIIADIVNFLVGDDPNNPNTSNPVVLFFDRLSLPLAVYGAVIGGAIGGLFSFLNDGNCDCGPATRIGVFIMNDNGDLCNPTYRLRAYGAGDDAEFFNWIVNEGNSGATYPAQPAILGVPPTQNSPDLPLSVSTTTLCAEDMGDEAAMLGNVYTEFPVNLFDSYRLVEEVGDVLVFGQFQQRPDGTLEISTSGNAEIIRPSSTNGGTLRNTFSIQFLSGFGSSTTTGEDEFRLFISGNVGDEGSFRVRGTNNCSGATSDLVFNYIIVE